MKRQTSRSKISKKLGFLDNYFTSHIIFDIKITQIMAQLEGFFFKATAVKLQKNSVHLIWKSWKL